MIDVAPSAVRYWQSEFDFSTSRTKYNKRQFTPEQVRNVLAVNYLLNIEFYTIRGAKIKYDLWRKDKYTIPEDFLQVPEDYGLNIIDDRISIL
jgi:DNA-binding transcriptional MerR regulator